MQTITYRNHLLNALAFMLVIPTVYFILISVLKYEFGVHGPFDAMAPFLERNGIKEQIGWNINLLILFGPLIAFAIAAWQVVRIEWQNSKQQFQINMSIVKSKFPLFIIFLSGLVLATLTIYMIGENLVVRE